MNKIFSIVWSHSQHAWVVVSELTAKRGKRSGSSNKSAGSIFGHSIMGGIIITGAMITGILPSIAHAQPPSKPIASNALPTGGQVTSGQVNISQSNSTMNIHQSTQKGIINWQTFNIGSGATVNFVQPNSSAATLNRVISSNASQIYGNLNANGQVFLINPNGVLFGKGARVDVGGMVASTLNIKDKDFNSGNYSFNADGTPGSIINEGELLGKYIALLAPEVRNDGVVIARQGTVAMAAGEQITLSIAGDQLIDVEVSQADFDTLVENKHLIEADEGLVILSAQSASQLLGQTVNTGEISAGGIVNDGGTVRLVASDKVEHSGSINVDGGEQGNGGSAILLASLDNPLSQTLVSGSLSAKGGQSDGNGGFIETSASKVTIDDAATMNTSALHGETGEWLIDPTDFTIGVNGDITADQVMSQLALNNVSILSANGGSGTNGDIFVNDSLNWSTNTLTLTADRNIEINAPITVTGDGGFSLEYGQSSTAGDFFNTGTYSISAPVNLSSGTSFSTKFGSDGSTVNYTVITDEAGLLAIDSGLTGNYVLGANISVATNPWNPLGNATGDFAFGTTGFTGILDGLGHTIDGLTRANTANSTGIGLFGQIGDQFTPGGIVQNLGLTNVNMAGLSEVGALAGANFGIVNNVYSTGTITGSDVVGANNDNIVAGVGGLIGTNGGLLTNSYADVNVSATTGDQSFGDGADGGAGGLVGINFAGTIDSSYALGDVSGKRDVGGLAGYTDSDISNSYSSGAVSGTTNVGGFVGAVFAVPFGPPLTMINSYWNTTTSGQATDGATGTVGLTDAQAKQQSSYTGFDFNDTWIMYDGFSQPLLQSMLTPYIVTVDDQSKTYDGSTFSGFTSTGSLDSQPAAITGTLAYSGTATTATNAGSYTISASGLSINDANKTDQHGYYISYVDGTLTIDQAALTVTATDDSKTYDGLAYTGGNGVSYTGFVNSEDNSVLGGSLAFSGDAQNATNAGSYTLTPGGLTSSNYSINFVDGTLTIDPAALTITATDDSKTYNGLAYTGGNGVSYSGFVNGEDASALGNSLTFSGDSQNATNAGTYTITPGGLTSSNYTISFVDGALTINPAALTVTANDDAKTYDGLAYSGGNGVSYSGFVNNEDNSVLGGTLAFSGDAQSATNAGTYTITPEGLTSSNYDITFENGGLTINQAALTITANDDSKTYDGLAYTGGNGVSYSGFVNGEDASVLGSSLTFGGNSQNATDAGSYTITPEGLTSSNYDITFENGALTVNQAELTVTADDQSMVEGNPLPDLTQTITGFVEGESQANSDLTGSGLATTNATADSIEGSFTISSEQGSLASNNYQFNFVDGTLTIEDDPDRVIGDPEAEELERRVESAVEIATKFDGDDVLSAFESASMISAFEEVAEFDGSEDSGNTSKSGTQSLQDAVDKHCEDCSLAETEEDELSAFEAGEKDREINLQIAFEQARTRADQAAQTTQTKSEEAAKTKQEAEAARKAAEEDPTNQEKQRAAEQANKKAEEANKELIQAASEQFEAEKEAQKKKQEVAGPKDRSEELNKISKAVEDQVKAFAYGWNRLFMAGGKELEGDAKKEYEDVAKAGKEAEEFLNNLPAGTKESAIIYFEDQSNLAKAKEEQKQANKEAAEAKQKLNDAQQKLEASKKAAEQAAKEAAEDPDNPEKALAAKQAELQVSKDSSDVIDARLESSDADKNASDKAADVVAASDKVDVSKAGFTAVLAAQDKEDADQDAEEKAKESVETALKAGFAKAFADISNAVDDYTSKQSQDASNKSDAANTQAQQSSEQADTASEEENVAKQEAKAAEEALKEISTAATDAAQRAAAAAKKAAEAPGKAAVLGQLGHLKPLLETLIKRRDSYSIQGGHKTAAQTALNILNDVLNNSESMDLATMEQKLASIKANAQNGLAQRSEYEEYNRQNRQHKKDYLDSSFDLKVALKPENLNAIAASARNASAQNEAKIAAQKADQARQESEKAAKKAADARSAAAAAVQKAKDAAEKARLAAQNSAADSAAAQAAQAEADAAAKTAEEQQALAKQFNDFAEKTKKEADDAQAASAAANVVAKKAAADNAAAIYAKKKAEAKLAENARINAERELADAKNRAEERKELAKETQQKAEQAKKDTQEAKEMAEQAKVDKAKWETVSSEKEKQIPKLNTKAEQDQKAADDKVDAAKKAGEKWKSMNAELDKLAPGQKAADDAQAAAKLELDRAKNALSKLGVLDGFKGSNMLELGLSIANEVDKSNKRGPAEERVAKAQADYDAKLKIAEQKTKEYNDLVDKTNKQAELEQQAVKEANDALQTAAKSKQAAEQAKLDKEAADANVKIYTKHIQDTAAYAQSMENYSEHVQSQANALTEATSGPVDKNVESAQQKLEQAKQAETQAKNDLSEAEQNAREAEKAAKDLE